MSVGASFLRREHSVRVVLSALCTACSKQFYRGWTTKAEIQFVQGAGRASKSRTMIWSKIIKQEKPRRNSSPWMLSLLLCVLCRASMPIFALGWRTSSASILYVGNIFLYAACIGWLLAGRGMQAQPGRRGADALWTYINVKQKKYGAQQIAKRICDFTPQAQGHVLLGLSDGIIRSNRQQCVHATNYDIWALLSASSMREQWIAAHAACCNSRAMAGVLLRKWGFWHGPVSCLTLAAFL